VAYLREPTLLSFAKAAHPSRVHRPAYPDYVSIRQIDADGKVIKECRFMGLYTSSVYGESVRVIPYIRRKVAEIERRSGFRPRPTWARNWPRCSKCCRATTCSRPRSTSCSAP
jgi:glutamate dehydrogenase